MQKSSKSKMAQIGHKEAISPKPTASGAALRGLRPRCALGSGLCAGQPRADDAEPDLGGAGLVSGP